MGRIAFCVCIAASVAFADVDTLVRRAQVRLDHGNTDGARTLLEHAVAEDPANGPALAMLAHVDQDHFIAWQLSYLEIGRPLDPARVHDALAMLRYNLTRLDRDECARMERDALASDDSEVEACGPCLRWRRPERLLPPAPAAGPLRTEAFGSPTQQWGAALQRIRARFEREKIEDAISWARLARLLWIVDDPEGARSALARATPSSFEELVACASGEMIASILEGRGRREEARDFARRAFASPRSDELIGELVWCSSAWADDPALVETFLARLREWRPPREWGIVSAAGLAVALGHADDGIRALDRFSAEIEDPTFGGPAEACIWLPEREAALAWLSAFAAQARLSNRQDAVLRASPQPRGPETAPEDVYVRARFTLEADLAFRALPGATYVLSLLYDRRREWDVVHRLRTEAYASGYRCRGLLIDLAEDGEEVLDELASLDPAAAAMERALRAGDRDSLRAFLERDDAGPCERALAVQILRQGGDEDEEAVGPAEEARRVWERMQTSPMKVLIARARPREVPRPADLAALVKMLEEEGGWSSDLLDLAVAAVREKGAPAARTLLDSKAGYAVADALARTAAVPIEAFLDEVRRQGSLHPLDLRWAEIVASALDRRDLPPDPTVEQAYAAAETRSPRAARLAIGAAQDEAEADAAIAKCLAIHAGQPPALVVPALGPSLKEPEFVPARVLAALVTERASAPDPPMWALWFVAHGAGGWSGKNATARSAAVAATERGFATSFYWGQHLARLDAEGLRKEVRRFLTGTRPGASTYADWCALDWAVGTLREAGRLEEGLAFVDAWAERCGWLSREERRVNPPVSSQPAALPRQFRDDENFRQSVMPPEAAAAQRLWNLGLLDAAWERLGRALKRMRSPQARRDCLLAMYAFADEPVNNKPRTADEAALRSVNACRALLALVEGPCPADLCECARARLVEHYAQVPSTRAAFVEALLRENPGEAASAEDARRWQELLSSDDLDARARAEAELRGMGMSGLPLLRALRGSTDAEVHSRAESVLEDLAAP